MDNSLSGWSDREGSLSSRSAPLKVLLETLPDLVWLKDLDGVYLECNQRFLEFFGKTREEVIGKTDHDFIDPELADFFREKDRLAIEAGKPSKNEETAMDSQSGRPVVLETIKTPLVNMDGVAEGVLGIARDITERKDAEEVLRHRLHEFTEPQEGLTDFDLGDLIDLQDLQVLQDGFAEAFEVASLITQLDGSPITRPSNFCELCYDVIRKTPKGLRNCMKSDACLGRFNPDGPNVQPCLSGGLWDAGVPIIVGDKHVANWLVGQVRDEHQSEEKILEYADKIEADPQRMLEAFRKVPKMSSERFKKVAEMLHMFAGQIANSAYQNLLQARHIAERKQFEQKVLKVNQELNETTQALETSNEELTIAVKKAEESDRLKSAFLANMSHEIRTPLNAIIGFASFLKDPEIERKDLARYVDIISNSGETLLELINNIIDISKIDAGLTKLENEPTDIKALMKSMYQIHECKVKDFGQSRFAMNLSLPPERLVVMCDEVRLKQVLDNLLSNACKFTNQGIVELGCKQEKDKLRFWVRDSGIGIDEKHHDLVFERFQQAEHNTERVYGGTGLGLSIAKSCVEIMGGRIWLESHAGEGSTFSFEIPYVPHGELDKAATSAKSNRVQFAGQHILVAEDDALNFEYLNALLKGLDLKVTHTVTGRETLKMYEKNKDIELILMDIRMPGIDGLEVTRRIRQSDHEVPIIAQTAYAFSSDREACLEAGCNGYLSKPMKKQELLDVLTSHLSKKR